MQAQKILVAVHGHGGDAGAVDLACFMARQNRGKVHLLYVIEVARSQPVDIDLPQSVVDRGEGILRELEDRARRAKCEAEGDVVQARNAGPAITEEAVQKGVDAIIVNMPKASRFGSFDMGHTVPYILRHAPCWVLVLREGLPATEGTNAWHHGG